MLLDWIKREPVRFSAFVEKTLAVVLIYAASYGMKPEIASGVTVAVGAALAWLTASVVVPTVKLSSATIERAAGMNKADIAKVAAVKTEAAEAARPLSERP